MRTNLHCHTTASDGELTPQNVVALAARKRVSVLAITDHDNVDGHAEAITAGQTLGVKIIPGIEISALSPQCEVHILGYGIVLAPSNPATKKIYTLREIRDSRAKKIIEKLAALGITVNFSRVQAIAGDGVIGRPHIAKALIEQKVVNDVQYAFDNYLAEGKPAYVPHLGLTPAQAVALIHDVGGIAVLAHPSLYKTDLQALLKQLVGFGLDGIEIYHPDNPQEHQQIYLNWAKKYGLIVTGGSDFHNNSSEHIDQFAQFSLSAYQLKAFLARLPSTIT